MKPTTTANLRAWCGTIPVTSLYTTGVGGTMFLRALKDRGELVGTRCSACRLTYLPAQPFCSRCFAELTESVPVKPEGEVVSFTVVHYDRDAARLDRPITIVAVRLDGADTVLIHYWLGKQLPQIGGRARVRFKPKNKRVGSILDLEGFVPI